MPTKTLIFNCHLYHHLSHHWCFYPDGEENCKDSSKLTNNEFISTHCKTAKRLPANTNITDSWLQKTHSKAGQPCWTGTVSLMDEQKPRDLENVQVKNQIKLSNHQTYSPNHQIYQSHHQINLSNHQIDLVIRSIYSIIWFTNAITRFTNPTFRFNNLHIRFSNPITIPIIILPFAHI